MASPVKISGVAIEPALLLSISLFGQHSCQRLFPSGCIALTRVRKRSRMGSAKSGFHTRLISHSDQGPDRG
ncbi:hypothetical protein D3C86_1620680 [compost metagenome]